MTRYQLSRIAVVFFGLTTIAIFLYASSGSYYGLFGSTELGLGVYFVNIALLVVSLIVFIWERAHKDMPRHTEEILLEKNLHQAKDAPSDALPDDISRNDILK